MASGGVGDKFQFLKAAEVDSFDVVTGRCAEFEEIIPSDRRCHVVSERVEVQEIRLKKTMIEDKSDPGFSPWSDDIVEQAKAAYGSWGDAETREEAFRRRKGQTLHADGPV
jgi:hypothetical protein